MGDRMKQSSQRRSTDPYGTYRHQHTQPKYAEPEYPSRRRHTEPKSNDAGLTRVHSRPEDYKNKPRPEKLFSYICFDDQGHPQDCEEVKKPQVKQTSKPSESHIEPPKSRCKGQHIQTRGSLHRVDSYSSNDWARTDDSGDEADSEEELTLPPMHHHDVGQKDDQWFSSHKPQSRSPERPQRTDMSPRIHAHHDNRRRNSPPPSSHRRRSSISPSSTSRHTSPTSSSHHRGNAQGESEGERSSSDSKKLIAQVAEHLQAHKDAYGHGGTKQLVNELLGEVVRKVADGGLDPKLMKDVVREVQHVL